jgi:ribosomal-protein-alanine N-acetyltransferase
MTPIPVPGARVHLRPLGPDDRDAFLVAVERSRRLHHPWVSPPATPEEFARYVRRDPSRLPMGVFRIRDDALVGVVNLSPIIRGAFQNAFMGYFAFTPYARKGYLREGIDLAVRHAFDDLGLHRVQANVRPENVASSELLRSLGFRLESHSPRYLFLDGAWRDHLGFVRLHEPEPPVAGAHGAVSLHEVDSFTWRDLWGVKARRDQARWVVEVPRYLAYCLVSGEWQPLAIRADDRTVGFVMWARDPADGSYWIGGFVIDRRDQALGYGRAALVALVEALRAKPGCREIALSYGPDNVAARHLYASMGFVETGEMEDDEVVARLRVGRRRRP